MINFTEITNEMTKDEAWNEVLERSLKEDCEFTPSERKIIRKLFWLGDESLVVATSRSGTVYEFENANVCARFFKISNSTICDAIASGKVISKGRLKGWKIVRVSV